LICCSSGILIRSAMLSRASATTAATLQE
jgi:hypothetical protein